MDAATQKKNARKKLLARLGIQSKDLLATALSVAGSGTIKRSEYLMYWEQVDGPSDATWMLGEIANMINKQLEGWKASSNASDSKGSSGGDASNPQSNPSAGSVASGQGAGGGVALDSLLSTFNFICLTLELLTADKKVKEVLATWSKIESVQNSSKNLSNQHPLFAQTKEIYRLLHLRVENHELIGPLILNCISMYSSIREFERMMDVIGYSTIDDAVDLKGGESAFYWEYIKRLARDGCAIPNTTSIGKTAPAVGAAASSSSSASQLSLILSNTLSKMITLPQQMKMNPKVAETTFCALMHMLKNLMTLHAITDANFIRQSLSTLQGFYLWPQPFGSQTANLLTDLQEESLIPGSFLRTRLEAEVHTAPYWDSDATPVIGNSSGSNGELSSALFYIYAQDDRAAQSYVQILDLKPWKPQTLRKAAAFVGKDADFMPALLTPTMQAMIVLNMLATETATAEGVENDAAHMRSCNADQVYTLYKKASALIQAVTDNPAAGKDMRARGMQEIRAALGAAAASSDKRDLVRLADKLTPPYTPSLPPVSHLSIPVPNTNSFHFDPRDQWRMVGHKVAPFAHVALAEKLGEVLAMYKDGAASRRTPLTFRLMLGGGDELLHQVLCAWCALKQTKPELFEGLRPKIFLLPFSKNHVSAFMARHDAWYNRHVYVPSRSNNFMVPWIKVDQNDMDVAAAAAAGGASSSSSAKSPTAGPMSPGSSAAAAMEEEGGELPPPSLFFRRSFESYAREATLQMDAQIWQAEGYLSPDSEGLRPDVRAKVPPIPGPDQLVPFLQRFEFGVLASAAEFKRNRKLGDNVRIEDIASGASSASKAFEYTPTEVVVKFTKLDSLGRITEVITEEPAVYQSVLLSAVPRRGDPTFPPTPVNLGLELHAKLHKSALAGASKQAALLGRKPVLTTDPKQHVVEVEVWASNPNSTFLVLLDGQLFGPYYRLKLLPCFDTHVDAAGQAVNTGKRMTFPLQHFFPMDI